MMNTIHADQLKALRESNEDFLLVNTLDEEHFEKTRIPGSINIPQSHDEFAQQVEQRAGGKDKKVVVYCASTECQSSTKGAQKLTEAGFTDVVDFEDGADGWKEAGEKLAVG
jgi:rhodanese-related sulfurtransferase